MIIEPLLIYAYALIVRYSNSIVITKKKSWKLTKKAEITEITHSFKVYELVALLSNAWIS